MRQQPLTGYLLHQRAYQDKRALYYVFTQQHGVVHGIGKRGFNVFELLDLFATGKNDLKTLTQMQIKQFQPAIVGQQQYAALYINELLYHLLPTEEPFNALWQHYHDTLTRLRTPLGYQDLKMVLRQFEQNLLQALGFELSVTVDAHGQPITETQHYRFLPEKGFEDIDKPNESKNERMDINALNVGGKQLLELQKLGLTGRTLPLWSTLHRLLIDHLLDYRPLQSRVLWQQQAKFNAVK